MAWKSHRYYIIYCKTGDEITPETMLCKCRLVYQSIVCGTERLKRYVLVDLPKDMNLYKEFKFQYWYKTKSKKKIKDVKYRIYEKKVSGLPEFKIIESNY